MKKSESDRRGCLTMDCLQGQKWIDITNSYCLRDSFGGHIDYKVLELTEYHKSSSPYNARTSLPIIHLSSGDRDQRGKLVV